MAASLEWQVLIWGYEKKKKRTVKRVLLAWCGASGITGITDRLEKTPNRKVRFLAEPGARHTTSRVTSVTPPPIILQEMPPKPPFRSKLPTKHKESALFTEHKLCLTRNSDRKKARAEIATGVKFRYSKDRYHQKRDLNLKSPSISAPLSQSSTTYTSGMQLDDIMAWSRIHSQVVRIYHDGI